jgi:hypothetical protein
MKTTEIDQSATELFDAAHEFQLAADEEWSAEATIATLARMEQGFLALAASSYEIRGKAAQDGAGGKKQRTVVLDEMAAAFARCARKCRESRQAIRAAEQSGTQEKPAIPKLVAL